MQTTAFFHQKYLVCIFHQMPCLHKKHKSFSSAQNETKVSAHSNSSCLHLEKPKKYKAFSRLHKASFLPTNRITQGVHLRYPIKLPLAFPLAFLSSSAPLVCLYCT
ncbi:hypothetical protein Droror1_Dr00015327 [Drosera rotundifolia]